MIRYLVPVAAAAINMGVVGCTSEDELVEEGDVLAETEQASIGDAACATVTPLASPDGISAAIGPHPSCSITFQTYTSPNTSYDWSPNACGHTYIGQITNTTNRAFEFAVGDAGPALNEDSCPLVAVIAAAHGRRVSDGLWYKLGETLYHGEWVSGPFFSGCVLVKDPGEVEIPAVTGTGLNNYSRVRVEGLSLGFGIFKRKVSVGIVYGNGPC